MFAAAGEPKQSRRAEGAKEADRLGEDPRGGAESWLRGRGRSRSNEEGARKSLKEEVRKIDKNRHVKSLHEGLSTVYHR